MRDFLNFIGLACITITLSSCGMVYTEEPIGNEPMPINSEDWQGWWQFNDEMIYVSVLDANAGKLQISGLYRDNSQIKAESYEILIKSGTNYNYANIFQNEENAYAFAQFKRNGDNVTAWAPDKDAIENAIFNGKLSGKIMNNHILLIKSKNGDFQASKEIDKNSEKLFNLREPIIFGRVLEKKD